MTKQKRNFIFYFFGGLIVVLVLVWTAVFAEAQKTESQLLEVTFFDVGQGDSILTPVTQKLYLYSG